MDRPLEREFAERAHRRALAMERQEIEEKVRQREWDWASSQTFPNGLDEKPWERRARLQAEEGQRREMQELDWSWSVGLTVQQLRALPYSIYLLTEHWQRVRLRALTSAGYQCQGCGFGTLLDVHHKTYERRGEELPSDVEVLCRSCHWEEHRNSQPQTQEDT